MQLNQSGIKQFLEKMRGWCSEGENMAFGNLEDGFSGATFWMIGMETSFCKVFFIGGLRHVGRAVFSKSWRHDLIITPRIMQSLCFQGMLKSDVSKYFTKLPRSWSFWLFFFYMFHPRSLLTSHNLGNVWLQNSHCVYWTTGTWSLDISKGDDAKRWLSINILMLALLQSVLPTAVLEHWIINLQFLTCDCNTCMLFKDCWLSAGRLWLY